MDGGGIGGGEGGAVGNARGNLCHARNDCVHGTEDVSNADIFDFGGLEGGCGEFGEGSLECRGEEGGGGDFGECSSACSAERGSNCGDDDDVSW